jgi:DNA-binding protein H-NS
MATHSYLQLQKQIEALQKQADSVRAEEIAGVIAKIKDAISTYDLSPQDLFGARAMVRKGRGVMGRTKSSLDAKYADGNGGTWVGRGPRPLWLREALAAGHSLEEFAIDGAAASGVARTAGRKSSAKKTAKRTGYKDDAGNSWSGFGRQPAWLKEALASGKTLEDLQA